MQTAGNEWQNLLFGMRSIVLRDNVRYLPETQHRNEVTAVCKEDTRCDDVFESIRRDDRKYCRDSHAKCPFLLEDMTTMGHLDKVYCIPSYKLIAVW